MADHFVVFHPDEMAYGFHWTGGTSIRVPFLLMQNSFRGLPSWQAPNFMRVLFSPFYGTGDWFILFLIAFALETFLPFLPRA